MIQREEIAHHSTHLFTSIMQITFPETDKIVEESHKGTLASVKSTPLQIKIRSFSPETGSSGLKQMSRGCQESTRDEKSLKRAEGDIYHKRKLKVLLAGSQLQEPFPGEVSIVCTPMRHRKRGEEGTLPPENKPNEGSTRKPMIHDLAAGDSQFSQVAKTL